MTMTTTSNVVAGASALTPSKGYKWIAREIARLDPEADYARIWALTTIYYGDDFFVNLLYATGMPCFTQSPFGSRLLTLRGEGKALSYKQERANDTLAHFWKWFECGPEHEDAQRSIEQVNRIHAAMATKIPEAFTNDDFVYTMAWLGTFLHKLRRFVGLPGFSDKQKIAACRFWREVAARMRGPHGAVHDFPADFDGMLACVAAFEARPWPQTDTGRQLAASLIEQFNEACLPRWAWPAGRQLILTVQAPHIRTLHRMGEPNPFAAWLIRKALFARTWMAENLRPDPRHNAAETARAAGNTAGQHREPPMVNSGECPFHKVGAMFARKARAPVE